MTDKYEFIACAKRVGNALIGRTDPSVSAVNKIVNEIGAAAPVSIRALWNETLAEPVPQLFADLLRELPEDDVLLPRGRRAAH